MDTNSRIFIIATIIAVFFKSGTCLDCYSCSNEDHNWKTCTKQIIQCARFQDACVSYTTFHRFIQYHPRSERWHNISKGCDVKESCERRASAINDALCDRSSRHEWACIECCQGDLCNYFVTLGSPRLFGWTSQGTVTCLCFIIITSLVGLIGR